MIIVSVLTVTLAITAKVYENKLGPIVLQNINEQTNSEISVNDIKFSFIKKFPFASFELENVIIKANENFKNNNVFSDFRNDTLLQASKVFMEFNVLDLLKKQYNITSVEFKDGKVNMLIDKNGLENYLILNKNTKGNQQLAIDLKNVSIKNVKILIVNQLQNYHTSFIIDQLVFKGNINKGESIIAANGNVQVKSLKINKINHRIERNINFQFNISKKENEYKFVKSYLTISGIRFSTIGEYLHSEIPQINILIQAENTELNSLIHLIPKKYINKYQNYEAYGNFGFKTHLKGNISKTKTPLVNIDFDLEQGSFINTKSNVVLSDLSINGNYSNGKSKSLETSVFNLKKVYFTIDSSVFSGSFEMQNFQNPILRINSKINVDLTQIQDFFKFDTIQIASGNLKSTFWFDGKFNDIRKPELDEVKNIKLTGEAYLANASLKFKGNSHLLSKINAKTVFANNDLRISKLSLFDGDNHFNMEGLIINLFPFIFFDNEKLFVDANLYSEYLELNNYFTHTEDGQEPNDSVKLIISENLSFSIGLNVKNFVYSKFKASNLKSLLHLQDKKLTAEQIIFNTMTGNASGNGIMYQDINNDFHVKLDTKLENIDISQLFYSFNNFNQEFLMDNNLDGQINGQIKFSGKWDKQFNIISDEVFSEGDLLVKNGELIDFEPMQSLSRFADVEELKHIKFSELKNKIYIKDGKVIIPEMNIYSTAFKIGISGEHTFGNEIDYHLNVLLSEVLSKRFKKRKAKDDKFTNIEDDGLGRTTLFLAITGTVDDYNVGYDKRKARKKIKQDIEKEKEEIKSILRDEFSLFKNDSSRKKTKRIEETDNMIFEFEGDTL